MDEAAAVGDVALQHAGDCVAARNEDYVSVVSLVQNDGLATGAVGVCRVGQQRGREIGDADLDIAERYVALEQVVLEDVEDLRMVVQVEVMGLCESCIARGDNLRLAHVSKWGFLKRNAAFGCGQLTVMEA